MPSYNRKQRRAAAAAATSSFPGDDDFDASSIPLAHPPASAPASRQKVKTLYEIAAERQAEFGPSKTPDLSSPRTKIDVIKLSPSGEISCFDPSPAPTSGNAVSGPDIHQSKLSMEPDEPIPPLPDTILLSLPLSTLHFTLSFLAAHQYAQEIPVRKLGVDTLLVAFPILTFVVHFAHGHVISFDRFKIGHDGDNERGEEKEKQKKQTTGDTKKPALDSANNTNSTFRSGFSFLFPPSPRTLVFLPMAISLGVHLVSITNEASYYAVMKKAPAIGTLWVWCVLELSLGPAILGLVGPVGWGILWRGYGII